jgi:hypothetical protein
LGRAGGGKLTINVTNVFSTAHLIVTIRVYK